MHTTHPRVAPIVGAATIELFSTPRLAPIAEKALAALDSWMEASNAYDRIKDSGTSYEVGAAATVMRDSCIHYRRLVNKLVKLTDGKVAVEAGLNQQRQDNIDWGHALDNTEEYAGLF